MRKQRVLITGAAGFLGSHLTDELLARGYQVIGIDDLSHGSIQNLQSAQQSSDFEFHQLDVCDTDALMDVSEGIDFVAHLAAHKIPRYGKAIDTLMINSQGGLSAL